MTIKPDRWVIITGANGGIGGALVKCFVDNGCNVIAADIEQLNTKLPNVCSLQVDLEKIVLDENYAKMFAEDVGKITGGKGPSALINNAAIQILDCSEDVVRSDWLKSMNINVSAPFFVSQLFLSELKENRGAIVNISSIHAHQTKRGFVTYATTKGALSSLTRNMAVDLKNTVRVNAIEPAAVDTAMLRASFEGKDAEFRLLESFHPVGRIASAKEIAQLAFFLCSDESSFIHGACIKATGGIDICLSDPSWN